MPHYPFGKKLFENPKAPNFRYADGCVYCIHNSSDNVCEKYHQLIGSSSYELTICDDYEEIMT